jgi:hypothetical protein
LEKTWEKYIDSWCEFQNLKARHFGIAWNVHGNSCVTSTMRSWSYHSLGLELQWMLESKHGENNGRNIRC